MLHAGVGCIGHRCVQTQPSTSLHRDSRADRGLGKGSSRSHAIMPYAGRHPRLGLPPCPVLVYRKAATLVLCLPYNEKITCLALKNVWLSFLVLFFKTYLSGPKTIFSYLYGPSVSFGDLTMLSEEKKDDFTPGEK
jgi:hypothetical protein